MMYSQETIDAVIDECGDFNSRFYPNEAVVRLVLEALESTAEQKALRADAERYLYSRMNFGIAVPDDEGSIVWHADEIDATIDKARVA